MTVYRRLKPVLDALGIQFRPAHRQKRPRGKRGRYRARAPPHY